MFSLVDILNVPLSVLINFKLMSFTIMSMFELPICRHLDGQSNVNKDNFVNLFDSICRSKL